MNFLLFEEPATPYLPFLCCFPRHAAPDGITRGLLGAFAEGYRGDGDTWGGWSATRAMAGRALRSSRPSRPTPPGWTPQLELASIVLASTQRDRPLEGAVRFAGATHADR